MPRSTFLEVPQGKNWVRMSVAGALSAGLRSGRCVECQQPVRAHKASVNGMAAHVEHRNKNPRCSLSDGRSPGGPSSQPSSRRSP
jgi:hypothetical protein